MRLSMLSQLLAGVASPAAFRAHCGAETHGHVTLERERGSVVNVRVDEDVDLSVSAEMLAVLCGLFVAGELTEDELAYIGDALMLSDRVTFQAEGLADIVFDFSIPSINGRFTPERARDAVETLSQGT